MAMTHHKYKFSFAQIEENKKPNSNIHAHRRFVFMTSLFEKKMNFWRKGPFCSNFFSNETLLLVVLLLLLSLNSHFTGRKEVIKMRKMQMKSRTAPVPILKKFDWICICSHQSALRKYDADCLNVHSFLTVAVTENIDSSRCLVMMWCYSILFNHKLKSLLRHNIDRSVDITANGCKFTCCLCWLKWSKYLQWPPLASLINIDISSEPWLCDCSSSSSSSIRVMLIIL